MRGFCPACGAPQLRVRTDVARDETPGETTGTLPPPLPKLVQWPVAMRCAALVASVVALLFVLALAIPLLSLLSLLMIFGSSFLAVALYRRRSPRSVMTPAIGARIGLSTGILMIAALAITLSATLLGARFRTHSMASFDAQWADQMQDLLARTRATTPIPPEAAQSMARPEFRAGSMLAALSTLSLFLVAISAGSGAFAGSISVRPHPGPDPS